MKDYLGSIKYKNSDVLWDLGANDGKYSRIASLYVNNHRNTNTFLYISI